MIPETWSQILKEKCAGSTFHRAAPPSHHQLNAPDGKSYILNKEFWR